jgi:hypothetical protein
MAVIIYAAANVFFALFLSHSLLPTASFPQAKEMQSDELIRSEEAVASCVMGIVKYSSINDFFVNHFFR